MYRIKLSDDVVCPSVVLLSVQRCGYADECGRAVDLYGDHRAGCGRVDVQGLVFKRFREKSTFFSAALLSSLIFGLMNGNLLQILYVGAMGMVLAYSYEICGTIKVPILLHITVNVMGILLTDSALGAWIQGDIMRLGGAVIVSAFVGSSMYVL